MLDLNKIAGTRVLVIGDFILDMYRILVAERLSPEADVLIFKQDSTEFRAGGAGNVAQNLFALGACPTLVSVVGSNYSQEAAASMKFNVKLFEANGRKTTLKERLITRKQQIARIDDQTKIPIEDKVTSEILKYALNELSETKALVLSDYDHGVMGQNLVIPIVTRARELKIPIIVDSKAKDTISKYRGSTIALPNNIEAKSFTDLYDFEEEAIAKYILKSMSLSAIGLTLGAKGILLIHDGKISLLPPLEEDIKSEVKDVTGAGDTVTSAVAAALATGASFEEAIRFANVAAGIVVRKLGVATASLDEIKHAIALHKVEI